MSAAVITATTPGVAVTTRRPDPRSGSGRDGTANARSAGRGRRRESRRRRTHPCPPPCAAHPPVARDGPPPCRPAAAARRLRMLRAFITAAMILRYPAQRQSTPPSPSITCCSLGARVTRRRAAADHQHAWPCRCRTALRRASGTPFAVRGTLHSRAIPRAFLPAGPRGAPRASCTHSPALRREGPCTRRSRPRRIPPWSP